MINSAGNKAGDGEQFFRRFFVGNAAVNHARIQVITAI